jgi:hypothetical protein
VTGKRRSSALDDLPRSLRDGQKRLVGVIDGYPSYYDRRRHRIDVLLEEQGERRYLSEYYWLRPEETIEGFVRQVEREGYDCEVLARWIPERRSDHRSAALRRELRRYGRVLYAGLRRCVGRTGKNV